MTGSSSAVKDAVAARATNKNLLHWKSTEELLYTGRWGKRWRSGLQRQIAHHPEKRQNRSVFRICAVEEPEMDHLTKAAVIRVYERCKHVLEEYEAEVDLRELGGEVRSGGNIPAFSFVPLPKEEDANEDEVVVLKARGQVYTMAADMDKMTDLESSMLDAVVSWFETQTNDKATDKVRAINSFLGAEKAFAYQNEWGGRRLTAIDAAKPASFNGSANVSNPQNDSSLGASLFLQPPEAKVPEESKKGGSLEVQPNLNRRLTSVAMDEQIEDLKAELAECKVMLERAKGDAADAIADLANLKSDQDEALQRERELTTELEAAHERMQHYAALRDSEQESRSTVINELEAAKTSITSLEQKVKAGEDALEDQKRKLALCEAQAMDLAARVEKLTREKTVLDQSMRDAVKEKKHLEEERSEAATERERLEEDLKQARKLQNESKSLTDDLNTKLRVYEKKVKALQEEIKKQKEEEEAAKKAGKRPKTPPPKEVIVERIVEVQVPVPAVCTHGPEISTLKRLLKGLAAMKRIPRSHKSNKGEANDEDYDTDELEELVPKTDEDDENDPDNMDMDMDDALEKLRDRTQQATSNAIREEFLSDDESPASEDTPKAQSKSKGTESLRKKLAASEEELNRKEATLSQLQEKVSALENTVQALQAEKVEMEGKLVRLDEMGKLVRQIKAQKMEDFANLQALQDEQAQMQSRLDAVTEELATVLKNADGNLTPALGTFARFFSRMKEQMKASAIRWEIRKTQIIAEERRQIEALLFLVDDDAPKTLPAFLKGLPNLDQSQLAALAPEAQSANVATRSNRTSALASREKEGKDKEASAAARDKARDQSAISKNPEEKGRAGPSGHVGDLLTIRPMANDRLAVSSSFKRQLASAEGLGSVEASAEGSAEVDAPAEPAGEGSGSAEAPLQAVGRRSKEFGGGVAKAAALSLSVAAMKKSLWRTAVVPGAEDRRLSASEDSRGTGSESRRLSASEDTRQASSTGPSKAPSGDDHETGGILGRPNIPPKPQQRPKNILTKTMTERRQDEALNVAQQRDGASKFTEGEVRAKPKPKGRETGERSEAESESKSARGAGHEAGQRRSKGTVNDGTGQGVSDEGRTQHATQQNELAEEHTHSSRETLSGVSHDNNEGGSVRPGQSAGRSRRDVQMNQLQLNQDRPSRQVGIGVGVGGGHTVSLGHHTLSQSQKVTTGSDQGEEMLSPRQQTGSARTPRDSASSLGAQSERAPPQGQTTSVRSVNTKVKLHVQQQLKAQMQQQGRAQWPMDPLQGVNQSSPAVRMLNLDSGPLRLGDGMAQLGQLSARSIGQPTERSHHTDPAQSHVGDGLGQLSARRLHVQSGARVVPGFTPSFNQADALRDHAGQSSSRSVAPATRPSPRVLSVAAAVQQATHALRSWTSPRESSPQRDVTEPKRPSTSGGHVTQAGMVSPANPIAAGHMASRMPVAFPRSPANQIAAGRRPNLQPIRSQQQQPPHQVAPHLSPPVQSDGAKPDMFTRSLHLQDESATSLKHAVSIGRAPRDLKVK